MNNLLVLLLAGQLSCGEEPQESSSDSSAGPPETAFALAESVDAPITKTLAAASERLLGLESSTCFLHSDRIQNIVVATNASGLVDGRVSYRPSGALRETVGHISLYGFAGQELDPSTDLHHFKHRYLDTTKAGWVSTDPLFAVVNPDKLKMTGQATHRYSYAGGRWVTGVDESGLMVIVHDPDRRNHKDTAARMGETVSALPNPHTIVRKGDIGDYRDIKSVALIGHTESWGAGTKVPRTMNMPIGNEGAVTPERAAALVHEAFPKARTVVLMGCSTASRQENVDGTFLENFAKSLKGLKQTGRILVVGGDGEVAPVREIRSSAGGGVHKDRYIGTGQATVLEFGGGAGKKRTTADLYKATGTGVGAQKTIGDSDRTKTSKGVFKNKSQ